MQEQPLSEAKSACSSDHCPSCGKTEYVTIERVVVGDTSVTTCYCKACDYSWHPLLKRH